MATVDEAAEPLLHLLKSSATASDRAVYVALDGRSGAGKSTLAEYVRTALGDDELRVAVIEGDQFYAGGSGETWDGRSAEDKVAMAMDWRRQHALLSNLRESGHASWRSFAWDAPDWDAHPPPLEADSQSLSISSTDVVLLEGAYSARPELHELLDVLVLLDPPSSVRRQQLLGREGDLYRDEWEARWSEAEDLYFGEVMAPHRFDLVID